MQGRPNVYFVVLNEFHSKVIPSQVIAPARAYASEFGNRMKVRVVFLEPMRTVWSRAARTRIKELRSLWPGGSISLHSYVGRLGRFSPSYTLYAVLRLRHSKKSPIVFHCRGAEASLQCKQLVRRLNCRVIFDTRGASDHETELRLKIQKPDLDRVTFQHSVQLALKTDREAAQAADAIIAVSEPLRHRTVEFLSDLTKPSLVVPCCVPSTRFSSDSRVRIRAELGLSSDELLMISVSSAAQWESWTQIANVFRAIHAKHPARLLFLTTLSSEIVLAGFPHDDPLRQRVLVRRVPSNEVVDYLSAAEIGVLLREPHPTHHFACPIKFAEYLSAGLAVIVNSGIGSFDILVREHQIGVVVPPGCLSNEIENQLDTFIARLQSGRMELRDRALSVCDRLFTWGHYAPAMEDLYVSLQGRPYIIASNGAKD